MCYLLPLSVTLAAFAASPHPHRRYMCRTAGTVTLSGGETAHAKTGGVRGLPGARGIPPAENSTKWGSAPRGAGVNTGAPTGSDHPIMLHFRTAGVTEVIPHGQDPHHATFSRDGKYLSVWRQVVRPATIKPGRGMRNHAGDRREASAGRPPVARSGLARDGTAKLARDGHGSGPCQIREMAVKRVRCRPPAWSRLGTPARQAGAGSGDVRHVVPIHTARMTHS